MKQKIMIDLETLDTSSTSLILSIGAVAFDETGLGRTFHVHIDPQSCLDIGLTICPRTVFWWLEQSEEARMNVLQAKRVSVFDALDQLAQAFDWQGTEVWANGASFDFSILKVAYDKIGLPVPWQYWNERCYRTVKGCASKADLDAARVEPTVAHDALADAIAQAQTLINIMNPPPSVTPLKEAAYG